MMKKTVLIMFFLLIATQLRAEDANDIAEKLQKTYEGISSVSADFTQEVYYKALNQRVKSAGRVYFKKPGKMRWQYAIPEKDEVVTNGKTLWIYQTDISQAIETSLNDGPPQVALNFLTGMGNLKKDFIMTFIAKKNDAYQISLNPREEAGGSIKKFFIEVDSKRFLVVKAIIEDAFGGETSVGFENIVVNSEIKDSFFEFKPPKGVTIIKP